MENLNNIYDKVIETDDLYKHYISNEELEDYSTPIQKAIRVVELMLLSGFECCGIKVDSRGVYLENQLGDSKKESVFKCLQREYFNEPEEWKKFYTIALHYRKVIHEGQNVSRGELFEFFTTYHCCLGYLLRKLSPLDCFFITDKDISEKIRNYVGNILNEVIDEENAMTFSSIHGVAVHNAALAYIGGGVGIVGGAGMAGGLGALMAMSPIVALAAGLVTIGASKIKDRRRKEEFYPVIVENMADRQKPIEAVTTTEIGNETATEVVDINTETVNIAEIKQIEDIMSTIVGKATAELLEKIEDSNKEIVVRLDNMREILKGLSEQITSYQNLIENMIEIASSEEERDRIIHTYSDICTTKIVNEIEKKYSSISRDEEEKKLIDSLGEECWNKLAEESRNYLISSKVTYRYYLNMNTIDYSGVCLLVTKALELEMSNRFYVDFVAYVKQKNEDSWKKHMMDFPSTLKKRYGNGETIKTRKEFTLGAVPYVLCAIPDNSVDKEQQSLNEKILLEFVRAELLKNYDMSDQELLSRLQEYGEQIEEITKKYRNRAAHTNELKKVDADECFEIVLDVEKILKKILQLFIK